MRLSWNGRARATDLAREWAGTAYEKGETQSFYNKFFDILSIRRRTVARYAEHVQRHDTTCVFIDLAWPRVLPVDQTRAGRELAATRDLVGTTRRTAWLPPSLDADGTTAMKRKGSCRG